MTTLLHIDASARKNRSISRALGESFKTTWLTHQPNDTLIYRDVGTNPPECISEPWIAAAFTPSAQRTDEQNSLLSLSDTLIAEVASAHVIIISTPMYNYGMPAALKAWVDQVVRVNETFTFDLARGDYPLAPTLSGKSLVLLTSSGEFGFNDGALRAHMNHLGPHLRTVSHYLGVNDMIEIGVEYQEFGDARHKRSIDAAYARIPHAVAHLLANRETKP